MADERCAWHEGFARVSPWMPRVEEPLKLCEGCGSVYGPSYMSSCSARIERLSRLKEDLEVLLKELGEATDSCRCAKEG